MSLTVDSSIEEVYDYLKVNLNFNEEILNKLKEEKIDGEALILLRKIDFKKFGIKLKDRNKIFEKIEKNIITNEKGYAKR